MISRSKEEDTKHCESIQSNTSVLRDARSQDVEGSLAGLGEVGVSRGFCNEFGLCLVFRTPDVELILSDRAFDEDEMAQKRLLMCPGWLVSLLLLYLAPYIKAGRPSAVNPILFSRSQSNLSDLRILDPPLALKASLDWL